MPKQAKYQIPFILAFLLLSLAIAIPAHCQEETSSSSPEAKTTESTEGASASTKEDTSSKAPEEKQVVIQAAPSQAPATSLSSINPQYQTDIQTGKATLSIPIIASPGRAGIQPNLSLSYQSGGPNTYCGNGFSLELGHIVRLGKRKGSPTYNDANDVFLLVNQGSSQELVSIGDSQYRPKIESSFARITYNATYWEVTDKSGVKYYFGQEEASRLQGPKGTYKWCLDKVIDTNSNYMTLSYQKDSNEIYPSQIKYTGNQAASFTPTNTITFVLEQRPKPIISSLFGFKVTLAKRLLEIDIDIDAVGRVRSYKFNYSDTYFNSLLTNITQYGSDGTSTLPSVTFDYNEKALSFSSYQTMVNPPDVSIDNSANRLVDINADGFVDIVRSNGNSWYCYKNNGDGSWATKQFMGDFADGSGSYYVKMVDINADGFVDIIRGSGYTWYWRQNSRGGFLDEQPMGTFYYDTPNYERMSFIDVNGDGFVDIIYCKNDDTSKWYWKRNNGDGTWADEAYVGVFYGSPGDSHIHFLDINADGLVDVIHGNDSNSWWWHKNNGDGTFGSETYMAEFYNSPGDEYNQYVDLNSDGLVDVVHGAGTTYSWHRNNGDGTWGEQDINFTFPVPTNNKCLRFVDLDQDGNTDLIYGTGSNWQWYRNIGNGTWENKGSLGASFSASIDNSYMQLIDIDGDGLLDIVDGTANYYKLWKPTATMAQQPLLELSNGIGAFTEISYIPLSRQYDSQQTPFFMHTVSSVTATDGMGNSYTTSYNYEEARYNYKSREFRGFRYVQSKDPENNLTRTCFYQDDIFKGKMFEQVIADENRCLYTQSQSSWVNQEIYPGVNFVYVYDQSNITYDGDNQTYKTSHTDYSYDDYGNPTLICNQGDTSILGDEISTYTEYTYDTSNWILNRPSRTYAKDSQQTKCSEKWLTYDSKGNLTKQESWLNTDTNPTVEYTYDTYGNLLTTKDPKANITTTEYETTYNAFPKKTTNAKGHTQSFTYDPKWGSILTSTDPNNQTTTTEYDVFGRPKKITAPSMPGESLTTEYEYTITGIPNTSTPNKIKKLQKSKTSGSNEETFTTYTFFDGFGRVIQQKSDSEDSQKQIVSGITTFDSRGLVKEKYLPCYAAKSEDYAIPDTSTPKTLNTYDPLGRLTQAFNPDSSYRTTTYQDWLVTQYDEEARRKDYLYDAYQRLIKVTEHNEGYTYETNYTYDAQGNLTQLKDSQNNITTITYDTLSRKVSMQDPDMGYWTYEYDQNSNLIKQTDSKGQAITFEYDQLNRLLKKTLSPRGEGEGEGEVAYFYDDPQKTACIGRLSKVTDQNSQTEFFYDTLGREIKTTKTINDTAYTVQRSYDAMDRLISLTYPDSSTVTYTYNNLSQIKTVQQGQTKYISNIDYTVTGQISQITYGNGNITIYQYDPNTLRLNSFKTNDGAVQDFSYTFDKTGNITNITDRKYTATQSFTYDNLSRLTNAQGPYGNLTYAYDSIGNIISKEGISYSYSSQRPHAVTGLSDGATFKYDENGNIAEKSTIVQGQQSTSIFNYDTENRLSSVSKQKQGDYTTNIHLNSGWNFFSLPILPDDLKIESIFSNLTKGQDYTQVSRTNCQEGCFDDYVANPGFDEFTSLEFARGYQVYINNPNGVDVPIKGKIPQPEDSGIDSGGIDQNTALLLHADGLDGETTFKDSSFYGHTPTAKGNSQIDTSQSKFGGSSAYFDGNSRLSTPDSDDWNFGSGDFTIDAWVRFNEAWNPVNGAWFAAQWNQDNNKRAWAFGYNGGELSLQAATDGYDYGSYGWNWKPTLNTWYHVAVVRNGNSLYGFVNGEQLGPAKTFTTTIYDSDANLTIADTTYGLNMPLNGWLDEIRISKGIARWTDNFTPPTEAYHNSIYQPSDNTIAKIELKQGWNLIGSPTIDSISTTTALNNLKLNQDYDKIRECTDTKAKTFKTPLFLTKGKSYYIHCLKDTTWNVPAYADTTSFTYDGDGGRLTKTSNNDITTYIGSLYETKLDGTTTKHIYCGSTRIASITLSPGGEGQGEGEKVSYYLSDHLGSSSVITDSSGNVTREYEYKPFGEIFTERIYDANSETPNFFFTGKRLDRETGLYYYGARYYDPVLGKFITPDTIVQAPFDPQSLNRYSYCRNNPILYIDSSGHFFHIIVAAVVGAIIGGVSAAINGQSIGKGILMGALSGAMVSCGAAGATALWGPAWGFVGAAVGGAASGATNAAICGGNIGQGALIGAIGSGVGYGIGYGAGKTFGDFWGAMAGGIGGGAVAGGVGAELSGGSFGQGAAQGAAYGGVGAFVGYGASRATAPRTNSQKAAQQLNIDEKPGPSRGQNVKVYKVNPETGQRTLDGVSTPDGYYKVSYAKGGEVVYRKFGGEADLFGNSWSPENAMNANFDSRMGLPTGNSGEFVARGTLKPGAIYFQRPALSSGSNMGGGTEYGLVNPEADVQVDWVHQK